MQEVTERLNHDFGIKDLFINSDQSLERFYSVFLINFLVMKVYIIDFNHFKLI